MTVYPYSAARSVGSGLVEILLCRIKPVGREKFLSLSENFAFCPW